MNSLFLISIILLVLSFIPPLHVVSEKFIFPLYLLKVSLSGWIVGGLYYYTTHLPL